VKRRGAGCIEIEADLVAAAIGEADAVAEGRVAQHVAKCESCRNEHSSYQAIDRELGVIQEAPLDAPGVAQSREHLETRLGAVINMSLVRELGPVLAATMLAGRVGSAMAAELGTMRVTEQIDAIYALGADPIKKLVVPRLIASVLVLPILATFSLVLGFSADAARLVRIIDGSPLFSGATLTSAITPDANERKDRFSIVFKLRGARAATARSRAAP